MRKAHWVATKWNHSGVNHLLINSIVYPLSNLKWLTRTWNVHNFQEILAASISTYFQNKWIRYVTWASVDILFSKFLRIYRMFSLKLRSFACLNSYLFDEVRAINDIFISHPTNTITFFFLNCFFFFKIKKTFHY